MSEELEDIVLEPEVPAEGAEKKVPEVSAEEGIAALQTKLDDEKKANEALANANAEANRQRNDAINRATLAYQEKFESDLALVSNAVDTLKRDQDVLESNMAAAASAGDWEQHAKFQRTLAENAAKLTTLENGKAGLEAKKNEKPDIIPIDPVEALAMQLSPRSASWVRAHPEYARDPALYAKMIATDGFARVSKNLVADSDEYFAFVEQELGIRKAEPPPAADSPLSEAASEVDTPPAAAPVRQGGNGSMRVKLTAAEREMAELSGLTAEEYAASKVAIEREGKLH